MITQDQTILVKLNSLPYFGMFSTFQNLNFTCGIVLQPSVVDEAIARGAVFGCILKATTMVTLW